MKKYKLKKNFLDNKRGTEVELRYWEGRGQYFTFTDEYGNTVDYWVSKHNSPLNIPDNIFKTI